MSSANYRRCGRKNFVSYRGSGCRDITKEGGVESGKYLLSCYNLEGCSFDVVRSEYQRRCMVLTSLLVAKRMTSSRIERWGKSDLPRKKFDGRQIRNIVTSSMGVARSRGSCSRMTYGDLMSVVNIMETFKTDLAYQMMQYEGMCIHKVDPTNL